MVDWAKEVGIDLGTQQRDAVDSLKFSINNALTVNPDKQAQALKLSSELDIPVSTAMDNMDEAQRRAQMERMDFESLYGKSPRTANYLANQQNANLSHDDVDGLTSLEKLFGGDVAQGIGRVADEGIMPSIRNLVDNINKPYQPTTYIGGSARAGGYDLMSAGAKLLDTVNPFTTSDQDLAVLYKNDPEGLRKARDSAAGSLSRFARNQTSEANRIMGALPDDVKAEYGSLEYATLDPEKAAYLSPTRMVGDVLRSLPTTAALALTMFMTRGAAMSAERAALANGMTQVEAKQVGIKAATQMATRFGSVSEGAIGYGQQSVQSQVDAEVVSQDVISQSPEYQQLVAQGYDPLAAQMLLSARAGQVSGLGAGMVDSQMNAIGGRFLGKIIGEGGALIPRILKGFGNEAGVEFFQSGGEQLFQNIATQAMIDPKQSIADGVLESMLQGFFVGGLSGGAFAGALGNTRKAEESEKTVGFIEKLNELAQASNTLRRDPATFEQFIADASEDGPIQQVFIDANTLMQSGIAEQVAQVSPSVAAQLEVAVKSGGQVAIPVAEYAARIAPTEYAQTLIDHLKTDPDGFTRTEAQEYMQTQGEQLKAEIERQLSEKAGDDTFKQSAQKVRDNIKAQLDSVDRFKSDVNDAYADMASKVLSVYAAKMNITPEQMYQRYPLRVTGKSPHGAHFDQATVADLSGSEIAPIDADTKTLRSATRTWYDANLRNTSVVNAKSGRTVEFRKAGKAFSTSANPEKLRLFAALNAIIANGEIHSTVEPDSKTKEPGVKAYHWLTAWVDIGGVPREVGVTLREDGNGHLYYNHNPIKEKAPTNPRRSQSANKAAGYTDGDAFEQSLIGDDDNVNLSILSQPVLNQSAWHGSPHRHTKFSLDHVGTGEGAQAYGWGLYFASLRDVAEWYRDNLSSRQGANPTNKKFGGKTPMGWYEHWQNFAYKVADPKEYYDRMAMLEDLEITWNAQAALRTGIENEYDQKALDWFKSTIADKFKRPGATYEVSIPEDDVMLLWDKTLEEQPEIVKKALSGIIASLKKSFPEFDESTATGGGIYNAYSEHRGRNPETASKALNEVGIQGIKYLDGTSRDGTSNEPSYNYVVFDDKAIEILNAYHQNNGAARGTFNPSTNTIALLDKADLSTFLHETGHFFLEVQFDLAAQIASEASVFGHETNTEGQQVILADTNALLKWFGIRDLAEWDGLTFEEKRSYHEQFARGFEAYLFEGKSPSIEMQGLFQRFRAWLLNVYKSLKALNVELTDDVRGVFDRMVATTEEIQLAEQGRSMIPMFETPEQAGMTVEEFRRYQAEGIDSTNEGIEQLQTKGLRDMQWLHNARGREIKKLQKKAAGLRAEMQIEARREVMSQPIYQAWSFLTRKITAEDKLPEQPNRTGDADVVNPDIDSLFVAIAKLGGIQRDSARVDLGVHKDVKSPQVGFGKYVLRNKGGMTVDNMAASLFELGYLKAHDLPEFEEKFTNELGGTPQYSIAYDYSNDYERAGDQVANPSALEAGRLDIAELNMMGLPQEVVNAIKARRMTAKNGLHPDIVSDKFEFTSGDELVRKLAAATAPKEAIESLTDQMMLERYGELSSPEAIATAADQAIHNNARARFIATEANALAKATGERQVLVSAARNFANALIGRLRVRDVKPTQYANAEQRASKAADKARHQGNLSVAAAEKRNQLAQTYAARAAYQALDDIDAALKYFERVQKPGKLPADYYERIMALLSKFDLRKSVTNKELDNAARFRTWVTAQLNSGNVPPNFESLLSEDQLRAYQKEVMSRNEDGELIYPDDESQAVLLATYFDEQPVRSYKDVTVSELMGLRDAVQQIEHLGKRTQKVLTDRKDREFAFAIDQMRTSIREVAEKKGRRAGDNITPNTKTGKEKNTVRGYFFDHIKAANLMNVMDGGSGGPLWEYLGRTANAAADGEALDLSAAHDRIHELLSLLTEGGKITGSGKFFETLGVSLNRQAIIAMAMNLGNESNMQRLLGGGLVVNGIPTMITMEQLQPALQTLTAKDWQFVQGMWDYYESFRPKVGEMERVVNGVEPTWIEARPLTVHTADGQTIQLRGGYAPVIFDPRSSARASMFEEEKDAKALLQAARVANTVRKSFTKERVEEVKGRPLMLDLGAFVGAFQDTIHYLHWQPWIIDANRIVKTLDPTIREYYGHEVVKQLRNWVRDSAVGIQAPRTTLERFGAMMARNVSFAGLAYNFFNAVQQLTGYSQSVAVLGSHWMMKGASYSLKNNRQAYLDCVDKSAFMRKRSQTRMRDIAEANLTIQDQNQIRTVVDRAGYAMMMAMQTSVDLPTWWGGYIKALSEGRSEETAISLADQAVIDSQGSGLKKDLAQYERESSGAIRILTGFMSFMNTTLNLNYRTLKNDSSMGGKALDLILINVIPVVMTMMLKSLLMPKAGDDDKDWAELAKDYSLEQLSFLLGQLVFVRELSQIGYAFTGQGRDYGGPSGLRWVGDLGKAATQIGQGDADQALLKSLVSVLGDFLRLPSAQINRTITGVEALSEGETENPGTVMFGFRR